MDSISILRQYKIGPFALFDTALAYLGIILISPLLSKISSLVQVSIMKKSWIWLTLPLSILFHVLFNQNTPLTTMFMNPDDFIVVKIIVVSMAYMGIKDIKIIRKK